jgi:hypothetical protein
MAQDPAAMNSAVATLHQARKNLEEMREIMANKQNEEKNLTALCIQKMIEHNKAYIDTGLKGPGQGPWWALCPHTTDGSLNRERLAELYEQVIEQIWLKFKRGEKPSVGDLITYHQNFLQPFSQRTLKLKLKQFRPTCPEAAPLVRWKNREES